MLKLATLDAIFNTWSFICVLRDRDRVHHVRVLRDRVHHVRVLRYCARFDLIHDDFCVLHEYFRYCESCDLYLILRLLNKHDEVQYPILQVDTLEQQ